MLRSSVLLLFVLINGIVANPVKPWEKVVNEAVQKGWISIDDKGMASWGEEVEPPEDMDKTSFDFDPSLKIWKKIQIEQSKQYQKAKPYEVNKPDAPPAVEANKHLEPEEDLDDIDHREIYQYLAPLEMGYKGERVVRPVHSEPELDEDALYHADVNSGRMMLDSGRMMLPPQPQTGISIKARVHMEPEKDMDAVYHPDPPAVILYNDEVQPAAEWPNVRRHTHPEEDLDGLYHD